MSYFKLETTFKHEEEVNDIFGCPINHVKNNALFLLSRYEKGKIYKLTLSIQEIDDTDIEHKDIKNG
jgi:hypothetical protein